VKGNHLEGYKFSVSFYSDNRVADNISSIFKMYGCPNSIIEVGVYEGYTTFWLSDMLTQYNQNLKIYAIDPHVGSNDLEEADFNKIREYFCHNLEVNKSKNVEYIQKFSSEGLIELINKGVKSEFIYIDGDHKASTVLSDLVLSWQLLKVGGVILCDDSTLWRFKDKNGEISPHMSPRMAIEMFMSCNWDKLEPLYLPHCGQTAFVKVKE